jgi:hypothetical protein
MESIGFSCGFRARRHSISPKREKIFMTKKVFVASAWQPLDLFRYDT